MKISQSTLSGIAAIAGSTEAAAHCDLPCGIYDPHQAQIAALTCIRMVDLMKELMDTMDPAAKDGHHSEIEVRSNFARAVAIKEAHAETCKREIRVIWGDYFKQEHLTKYPELNDLVHKIMELGSKAKQTVERQQGEQLLESVNRFAEIFWETKGKTTKRVKAPYKPESEIVIPVLE